MDRVVKIYTENISNKDVTDVITNDKNKINFLNPKKRKNDHDHYSQIQKTKIHG